MGLLLVEVSSNTVGGLFEIPLENVILRLLLIGSILYEFKQYVKCRLTYGLFHEISIIIFHEILDKRLSEYLRECIKQNLQRQRTESFLLEHFLNVVDDEMVENDQRSGRYFLDQDGHKVFV